MLELIAKGANLGYVAGVLPGPLQAYLVNATLTLGWRKSIWIIFAPLISDIPIVIVIVFLLQQLPPGIIPILRLVGGLFLFWIAYGTWKQFRAGVTIGARNTASQQALTRGILMNFLSPAPYLFWSTVNGPLLLEALEQSSLHAVAFVVAFYGTFLAFMALIVLVFNSLRRLDERITRGLMLLTIVILVGFGLMLIGQGLGILQT
jgi:threonine/homoserine/homoserine lactone efflux protein